MGGATWTRSCSAVGSGGTLTGLSRFFAAHAPHVDLILADPVGSVLTNTSTEGTLEPSGGSWTVEGIGEDYLPAISEFTRCEGLRDQRQARASRWRASC
jgi:cysteine synthase